MKITNVKFFKVSGKGPVLAFANIILDNKFIIRCLNAKGGEKLSRKDIDDFTKYVGIFGAKGLAWMRVTENGLESNIVKFFSKENQNKILIAGRVSP